jgi:hypothetical protein
VFAIVFQSDRIEVVFDQKIKLDYTISIANPAWNSLRKNAHLTAGFHVEGLAGLVGLSLFNKLEPGT